MNRRAKAIKLFKNIQVNLHNLGVGNGCPDMTPKAQETKG